MCTLKKNQAHRCRERNGGYQGLGGVGGGKWGDARQREEAFSYKMNRSWGSKVQHGDYS